jgi:hypothetical protein
VWKLPVLSEKGAFIGFVSKKKIFTRYRQLLKQYSQGDIIFRDEEERMPKG